MRMDGYAGQRGFDPRSMGAAIVVSGAMIGALLFSSPVIDIIIKKPGRTVIDFIPIDVPPPPNPETKPETRQTERVFIPDRTVPTPTQDPTFTTTTVDPGPPPSPGTLDGNGAGTGTAIETPAAPLPLIGAQPDPRYAADFQPDYPSSELRAERGGRVIVRILVGVDGRVKQIESVSTTSEAFFDATKRRALSRWRFRPATRGGVPEAAWRTMAVNFVLTDAR